MTPKQLERARDDVKWQLFKEIIQDIGIVALGAVAFISGILLLTYIMII